MYILYIYIHSIDYDSSTDIQYDTLFLIDHAPISPSNDGTVTSKNASFTWPLMVSRSCFKHLYKDQENAGVAAAAGDASRLSSPKGGAAPCGMDELRMIGIIYHTYREYMYSR